MYGLRLLIKFSDKNGKLYYTNILERDYSGASVVRDVTGQPLSFQYGDGTVDDHLHVIGTVANIAFYTETPFELSDLYTADKRKYKVVTRTDDPDTGTIIFQGWLTPQQYSEQIAYKADVELSAVCGLGELGDIDYLQADGTAYTGIKSYKQILVDILSKLELDIDIHIAVDFRATGVAGDPLAGQDIDVSIYEGLSCDDVLQQILPECRIMQRENGWWIESFNNLGRASFMAYHYDYTGAAKATASSTITPGKNIDYDVLTVYEGVYDRMNAWDKVVITQDYGKRDNLITNGDFTNGSTGWTPAGVTIDLRKYDDDKYYAYLRGGTQDVSDPDTLSHYITQTLYGLKATNGNKANLKLQYGLMGTDGHSAPMYIMLKLWGTTNTYYGTFVINPDGETYHIEFRTEAQIAPYPYITLQLGGTPAGYKNIDAKPYDEVADNLQSFDFDIDSLPEDGNLQIYLFAARTGDAAIAGPVYTDAKWNFKDGNADELPADIEVTGYNANVYIDVKDDVSLLQGTLPDYTNAGNQYQGGILKSATAGDLAASFGVDGSGLTYGYTELIARLMISRRNYPNFVFNGTIEGYMHPGEVLTDVRYPSAKLVFNGVTWDVANNEWQGAWVEVIPFESTATVNSNERVTNDSATSVRASGPTKTRVFSNASTGTPVRINDLLSLSLLSDDYFFEADKIGTTESKKVSALTFKDYLATYLWAKTDLVESAQYLYANGQKIKAGYADNAGLLDNIDSSQFLRRDIDQTVNANTEWLSNLIANAGFEAGINGHVILEMTAGLMLVHEDISTPDYISKTIGWKADKAGNFDVRTIYTDELIAKAFTADISQALAGSDFLTKSVSKLSANFTVPATGNTSQLIIDDLEGFPGVRAFQDNDYIRLRVFDRSGGGLTIADVWGTVILNASYGTGGFASDNTQAYIFTSTDDGGASGLLVYKGAEVLDYGKSGDGLIERTVLDAAGAPYSQVVKWTSDPSVPGNYQVLTRMGVLDGIANASGAGLYGENTFLTEKLLVGDLTKAGNYLEYVNGVLTINAVINVISGGNAETQSGAQAKVDAVQVGVTNLLLNSSFDTDLNHWVGPGTLFTNNVGTFLKLSAASTYVDEYQIVDVKPNSEYTLSFTFQSHDAAGQALNVFAVELKSDGLTPTDVYTDHYHQYTTPITRYSFTFTTQSDAAKLRVIFRASANTTIYVDKPKLAVGNKSDDWSPNPADLKSYTDAAQAAAQSYADNSVSTLQSSLGAMAYEAMVGLAKLNSTIIDGGYIKTSLINAGALVISNAQVTGLGALALLNGLTYSDVGADASGSAASAQSTAIATAAADATAKVDAVQIGGTNLIPDSKGDKLSAFNGAGGQSVIDGFSCVYKTANASSYADFYSRYSTSIESGIEYTVSFFYKSAGSINFLRIFNYPTTGYFTSPPISPSSTWKKYKYTFTLNAAVTSMPVMFRVSATSAGTATFYVRNVKLEVGNKASDWSPAPEDVNAAISAVDAAKLDAIINGKTVIVNGLVDTSFLNTTWLQAQLITASNIAALSVDFVQGTIGGININAGSIASSNGNFSVDSLGALIATKATIKSAASGQRIEISSSTNDLRFYNASGVLKAQLGINGGWPALVIGDKSYVTENGINYQTPTTQFTANSNGVFARVLLLGNGQSSNFINSLYVNSNGILIFRNSNGTEKQILLG